MSIEKAKNGYRVRVYYYNAEKDKRVQYSSKIVETKRAAKELEAQLLKELPQDKITALSISKNRKINNLIFNDIVQEFLKEQSTYLSKSTYIVKKKIIENHLIPFFKDYDIRLIDKNVARLFKDSLIQKKLSSDTIKIYVNILSQIIDFCVEYYNLNSNILKGFKLKLKPVQKEINNYFTLEEFNHFIQYENHFLYKTLWVLLFTTGLRIGEAVALKWKDVDFIKKELYINSSKSVITKEVKELKNYEERFIQINDNLITMLKELKENSSSSFVFEGLYYETVAYALRKTIKLANSKKITVHGFRHSHASLMFNNNIPLRLISKRLGHKDINTTLKNYIHFYKNEDTEMNKFINKINEMIVK